MEPAGFLARLTAFLVDGFIMGAINQVLNLIIAQVALKTGLVASAAELFRRTLPTRDLSNPVQLNPLTGINFFPILLGVVGAMAAIFIFFIPLHYIILKPLSRTGQTPGKRLMKIRLISNETLAPLTYGKVILRETLGKMLSALTLGIGYLMAGFGKKRALHDHVANSKVVRVKE